MCLWLQVFFIPPIASHKGSLTARMQLTMETSLYFASFFVERVQIKWEGLKQLVVLFAWIDGCSAYLLHIVRNIW